MKAFKTMPMIIPSYEGFPLPEEKRDGTWGLANPYNQSTVTPPLPGEYLLEVKRVVLDAPESDPAVASIGWVNTPEREISLRWGETILVRKHVYGGWVQVCEYGLRPPVLVSLVSDRMF